jgi:hypothetical protein
MLKDDIEKKNEFKRKIKVKNITTKRIDIKLDRKKKLRMKL